MANELATSLTCLKGPVPPIIQLILKVASRCNLNCSYCYVYNQADSTWKQRPVIMSDGIFEAALERIHQHCRYSGQKSLRICFHGGEPCLIGVQRFDSWCTDARRVLSGSMAVQLVIQTNGTLLDDSWAEVFRKHDVMVGVSLDGPKEHNDIFRVNHAGLGSYNEVARGIKILQRAQVPYGILCVIPLGAKPLSVHRHFLELGSTRVTYLLPHFTHDTIAHIRQRYGATPCADFLVPIFDDWWFNGTMDIQIRDLRNMARIILGGSSQIETFGNVPPRYVFVETDGAIEGLDCLRVCKDRITPIGLNVLNADFREILQTDNMHRTAIFEGMALPRACRGCPEEHTCGGGYLPHRYSSARGFDNPSVWCADLLKLFTHLRLRLDVPVEETLLRQQSLQGGACGTPALPLRQGMDYQ
jgi:uncharacterized protein